nr:immunoglobulin light chain junction region [Macaca mulatta]
CQQCTTVPYSF